MKYHDLTIPLSDGFPTFPPIIKVAFNHIYTHEENGAMSTMVLMSTHHGTHLESPLHMIEDAESIDKLPLEKLIGKATVIDLTHKKAGQDIVAADLIPYSQRIEKTPKILLRMDWSKKLGSREYLENFPSITLEAAKWLSEKNLDIVGVDTPAAVFRGDPGALKPALSAHVTILKKGTLILEGLTNLCAIKNETFDLIVLPLKLEGIEACPARVIAIEQ